MQLLLCPWLCALLRPGGWELQPTALAGMLDGGSQEPSAGRDGGGGARRYNRAVTLLATHCRGDSLWDVERSRKSSEHPRKAWETADFEEKPKYILPLRGLFSSNSSTLSIFPRAWLYPFPDLMYKGNEDFFENPVSFPLVFQQLSLLWSFQPDNALLSFLN